MRQVDVAIITIKHEEFRAMRDQLRAGEPERYQGKRLYPIYSMPVRGSNRPLSVALVRQPKQGNITSQTITKDIIDDLDPQWILVVGIAGAVPNTEFSLGDVVLAESVIEFTVEKISESKGAEFDADGRHSHERVEDYISVMDAFESELGDWSTIERSDGDAAQPIEYPDQDIELPELFGDEAWRNSVRASLRAWAARTPRRPVVRPVKLASSDKLVTDTKVFRTLLPAMRKIGAVEMETAGVYAAARQRGDDQPDYPVLTVRGISDIVGLKRDDGWTLYACHSAAAFAAAFLRSGHIPPRGDEDEAIEEFDELAPPEWTVPAGWMEVTPAFLDRIRRELSREERELFYNGQEPTWRHAIDAGDGAIPRRQIARDAIDAVNQASAATLVLLVGPSGEGKSLMTLQIAVDLVRSGSRVLFRQGEGRLDGVELADLPEGSRWVCVSDDADVIAEDLERQIKLLRTRDRGDVHLVLAARDTDWRARFRGRRRSPEPYWEHLIRVWPARRSGSHALGMTESDAQAVVAAWEASGCLGALESIDQSERAGSLRDAATNRGDISDGTFFGGILDKRFGAAGLTGHVQNLMNRLAEQRHTLDSGHTLRDAFLYPVATDAIGIDGVDIKVVAQLVGVEVGRRRDEILHALGREAATTGGGESLRTRHPAIAKTAARLMEEGRIPADLEDVYKSLVTVTGELGREGGVDVSHGDIMNCAPKILRQLPRLTGVDERRAARIACEVADTASQVLHDHLVVRVTQAKTYREAGRRDESADIILGALSDLQRFRDRRRRVRSALFELGVVMGSLGDYRHNVWLAGASLSDEVSPDGPDREHARRVLTGLALACQHLHRQQPDEVLARAVRAASVLYPRTETRHSPSEDSGTQRTAAWRRFADEAGVPRCSTIEAFRWLREAIRWSEDQLTHVGITHFRDTVWSEGSFMNHQRLAAGLPM